MELFSASPKEMVKSIIRNRSLIYQMSKREVVGRYKGSVMGLLWSFFNPVLMLLVYTFIFGMVFKARWPGVTNNMEFAGILFAGLIIYSLFAECVSRAPTLIVSNVNYVKKVIFPLEILPLIALGNSLFHACVSVAILLLLMLILSGGLQWTALFFPLIILPLLLLTMGVSWVLASLGVYSRDLGQVISFVVTAMLFLSPIFFPASAFPESYSVLFYLNPLTFIIEQFRDVLLWGALPNWQGLGVYIIVSSFVAWLGFAWFQKIRKGFSDVL
ncbi:MAG: ABC transporter permease [Gammaproteobacteria bacterium]|nr:ABC transporter permease [Gammaproteobacteria bacterium]